MGGWMIGLLGLSGGGEDEDRNEQNGSGGRLCMMWRESKGAAGRKDQHCLSRSTVQQMHLIRRPTVLLALPVPRTHHAENKKFSSDIKNPDDDGVDYFEWEIV
jgi:hypothetical protein